MIPREYSYDVDAEGRIRSGSGDVWTPTGVMLLDGIRRTTWLGPFDVCERDLLRVMASVLDADRLSPRRVTEGRRATRSLSWQRTIELRIAVEDPERWTLVASRLARLLGFMTDDAWDVGFTAAERPTIQGLLPHTELEQPSEVALFSGGLDSIAGLYARSLPGNATFVAVSACGTEVAGRAQADALQGARDLGVKATSLKLVHQLRETHRGRSRMESSQRTRGLLFLAMGAATASRLRMPTFSVYETGVGCINLPMSRAQVGAQGTRAMHPRTLALFDELLASALDRPVRVVAPFFLLTKGELCLRAGAALNRLAGLTMSCDEGEGHKPDAMEHCGLCTSCLFRRIALFATERSDPTKYRDVFMRRHGHYEQRMFESHATELLACKTFSDLVAIDPNARFASRLPLEGELTRSNAESRVLELYRRYASEIVTFFDRARPTIAPRRPCPPRKENERDLFPAVG
jgi:7-cyano-7-deazaguanine synthase in queuosine biosynthesis